MLDFSKAFDLTNYHLLLDKLQSYGLPAHILRWMSIRQSSTSKKLEMNIPILVIPMGEYRKGHCLDLNVSLFT